MSCTSPPREISIEISLSDSLRGSAEEQDTVFVYAREPTGRIPVAATKLKVKDLSRAVLLNESMKLINNYTLAGVDQVLVVARVSKGSNPHKTKAGDLIGESATLSFATGHVQRAVVVIDQLVK